MIEAHDGTGWHLVVTVAAKSLTCVIERLVDEDWLVAQEWACPMPDPKQRRPLIINSAKTHGWAVLVDRWPRLLHGRLVLDQLFPVDWALIVQEVSARRKQVLLAAGAADRAWRMAMIEAQVTGHMSAPAVAAAAGVPKTTVYRAKVDDLRGGNAGSLLEAARALKTARQGEDDDE